MSGDLTPMQPRVASWPHWYGPNPYQPLLYEALASHGIRHVPNVPLDPSAFRGPSRVADVVHLHWLYSLFRPADRSWFASRRGVEEGLARLDALAAIGVPIAWTVHNLVPHDGFRRKERAAYAAVHRRVNLRIFHSESSRRQAEAEFGDVGGTALVMYHGNYAGAFPAPTPRPRVRAREGIPDDRRLLLCVGQIRAYKGFDVAVRMMRSSADDSWHLVVAGRPIDRSVRRLRRLASGLDRVTLLPHELSSQRIADLLGAADVVLLPYRAITGSGVLLHALTAGRGVVATDLPYFREILGREPNAGVLVGADDPRLLAAGIRDYFATDDRRRSAAARALSASFDWAGVVEPLADWFRAAALSEP